MKLIDNWKPVLVGSWSSRAAVALGMLLTVQATLPQVAAIVSPQAYASITAAIALAIPVLRVLQQSKL